MNTIEANDDGAMVVECPVCKHVVSNEVEYDPCAHVALVYVQAAGEFVEINKDLKKVAKQILDAHSDGDKGVGELMDEYAHKSRGKFEVFEATTEGLCCGPCSFTDYYMFRMETESKNKQRKRGKK